MPLIIFQIKPATCGSRGEPRAMREARESLAQDRLGRSVGPPPAHSPQTPGAKSRLRDTAESLLLAFFLLFIAYLCFWQVNIDGVSMRPTLDTGDRVIVSRAMALLNQIRRGDIVICKIPVDGVSRTAVKRVIGLPGDAISVSGGRVYVNGAPAAESYAHGSPGPDMSVILTGGQYFVMGDNRQESYDSRAAGPLPRERLVAKVLFEFFPKFKDV